MDEIETSSTSAKTADASPVVLRLTDRIRLVFRPTLIQNDAQPRACINGEFVYERKNVKDEWAPANDTSLGTLKAGEQYKLELHSAELLALVEALGPLYRARWAERGTLPQGKHKYVKMEVGVARFLQLNQTELEGFLNAHPADAITVLSKLLRWLATGTTTSAASSLAAMSPDEMPAVSALLGLSTLKAAVTFWQAHQANTDENFWQATFARFSFVLSQLFAQPIVVIQEKAYLGGKALDNTGGSLLDFLASLTATGAVALIEIKTPSTPLLGKEYRVGAFPASVDLAGAISQVLKYRHTLSTSFHALQAQAQHDMTLGAAPCVVIIGDTAQLDTKEKRESFEAFRSELRGVRVVTYDELFKKTQDSAALLEGIPS